MPDDIKAHSDTVRYQTINADRHIHSFEDQRFVNAHETHVMVRGQGMHLWDSDGRRYLDGMSGLFCTAVGYGRRELAEAASRQMQELSYCNILFNNTHMPANDLSEKLFSLLPSRYSRVVYTNSGSEANEVLIRTVRLYWDTLGKPSKKILIGRDMAYHGSTVGSASLGGMAFMHAMGDLPIPDIQHIPAPYWYACCEDMTPEEFGLRMARELEAKILALGPERVAAFVGEPFLGAAGAIFPPSTYWPEIQRICRQYDVLLCVDEVTGGFGRTGEWFSHQLYGIEPDTISIAKGLTSGYMPMGGLILARHIADVVTSGMFAHGLTSQGHPVVAAVALANLRLLDEGGIVDTVRTDTGPYLQRSLRELFGEHPMIGEIQGAGAVAALQFTQSRARKLRMDNEFLASYYCMQMGLEEGIIVRPAQGRILMAPALIATRADIDELLCKLKRAVDRTAQKFGIA